ncbi:hypothetical protein [Undibacterium sp.]|uniref:hypothetical protein n=1 Tax=Undibacterium sp. TaxID=1914977 RepID=UPI0027315748|nr:hypothetical protein [Undibacterium sp.]MDP1978688.1 hypothetical protein [Undibacterium sp.]
MTLSTIDLMTKIHRDIDILECAIARIDLCRRDALHICQIFYALGSFLNQLQLVSSNWAAQYQDFTLDIEIEYALSLDEEAEEMRDSRKKVICTCLDGLKELILNKIKDSKNTLLECLNFSDPDVSDIATLLDAQWLMCPKCTDAWESVSPRPMVICPKCKRLLQNPRVCQRMAN